MTGCIGVLPNHSLGDVLSTFIQGVNTLHLKVTNTAIWKYLTRWCQMFFIFTSTWGNDPIRLMFFRVG